MAKADRSIDPRILESAKEEFLALGFEKASLKNICRRAQVTTGALYNRYQGKEDLFCAVVAPTVEDLDRVMKERGFVDVSALTDRQLVLEWSMSMPEMMWWFRFLHARRDGFVLLISRAEGTRYANFQHDWVEKMSNVTYGHYREAYKRGLAAVDLSKQELHVLMTAFWTVIYEPFIHGYSPEELEAHCTISCRLFNWHRAFLFQDVT